VQNEKERMAWIVALAGAVSALIAVLAYFWPHQTDQAAPPVATATARPSSPAGAPASPGRTAVAAPPSQEGRFLPEYTATAFTTPDPGAAPSTTWTRSCSPTGGRRWAPTRH
jgi:hypothetical protein